MKYEHAVSYVIYDEHHNVLTVKRPEDDPRLPALWGLPAGLVNPSETTEQAVLRSGFEKLGVLVSVIKFISRGSQIIGDYRTLTMNLFEVKIVQGKPIAPQPYPEVTQYQELVWGLPESLQPAAEKGSLCTKLFLDSLHV